MTGGEYDPTALPAACLALNVPAVGDSEQNRDGKKIVCKNVSVKGYIQRAASEDAVNPPASEKVFVALVLDTQTNGAQCQSEDIYKNLAADNGGCVAPLRNLLFGERFRILKSELFDMDQTVSVEGADLHSSPAISKTFDWFVNLNDLPVQFNAGTTAVIANCVDNSLHMVAFSVSGLCTMSYNARVRFMG